MTSQVPKPDAAPREALAQRVRQLLESETTLSERRMFGAICFMVNGHMAVAAGRAGDLLVRTDPAKIDEMRERGAVTAFMGNDRPMGHGWLNVPQQQLADQTELAFWVEVGVHSRDTELTE